MNNYQIPQQSIPNMNNYQIPQQGTPNMGMGMRLPQMSPQPIIIPMMNMQQPMRQMPPMTRSRPHHNPIVLMIIIFTFILILSFVLLEYFPEKLPENVTANAHVHEIQKQFDRLKALISKDEKPGDDEHK